MYSKNDYRYYREDRLVHSDDFLAHYGVKGMKWKNRKNVISDQVRGIKETRKWSIGLPIGISNYSPSRTKRVGTNTNSLKTRLKDAARRRRLKSNARSSVFDKSNWKREKSNRDYVGTPRQTKRDKARDKQLRSLAKERNANKNTMKLNKNTSVSYGEATIKPKSSNSSNTSQKKKKKTASKKSMKLNKRTTVTFNDATIK